MTYMTIYDINVSLIYMEMISEKILYLRYQTHRLLVSMSPHRLQVHIRRKNYLHDFNDAYRTKYKIF